MTRADIYNGGAYEQTALYKEYRAWWYLKRRDFFEGAKRYLRDNGIDGAKLFYDSCMAEPGEFWGDKNSRFRGWQNPTAVFESTDADKTFGGKTWQQMSGKSAVVNQIPHMNQRYWAEALDTDFPTWGKIEVNHSGPADDYGNYADRSDVALCYPFSCVYQVVLGTASDKYRNATDDLFMMRHYSLNENNLSSETGLVNGFCGYYTMDWDRAGRAVMISELWAMAMNDPTMIGYLFGSNLDRLDAPFVREFNLNFLSLPATESTVLQGGAWTGSPGGITVRRWTTGAGNYYAVINTASSAWRGTVDFRTSKAKVWRTVDFAEEALSGGKFALDMEPYQMIAFTDVAPDAAAVSVSAADVGARSATAVVKLSTVPSSGCSVTVEFATKSDFSDAVAARTWTAAESGTVEVPLSGLSSVSFYYLRASIDGGASAVSGFTTTTPSEWPLASDLSAAASGASHAVLFFALERLGEGSSAATVHVSATAAGGAVPALAFDFPVSAAGPVELPLAGLSSELAWTFDLAADNDLVSGVPLGSVSCTTPAVAKAAEGEGILEPGLVQASYGTGADEETLDRETGIYAHATATRTPGAGMATLSANYYNHETNGWTNPYDGRTWYYGTYNTQYGYSGQIWLDASKTYTIGKSYANGAVLSIDGAVVLESLTRGAFVTARHVPSFTGWHDFELRLSANTGDKGSWYNWAGKGLGVAFNTEGVTSSTSVDRWTPFMDPGDGSLLRCHGFRPVLVSLGGAPWRAGGSLRVPVLVDSWDADNALAVYAAPAAPAGGDPGDMLAWAASAVSADGEAPAVGLAEAQTVAVPGAVPAPGETWSVAARLTNARTGYDCWSEVGTYVVPDTPIALSAASGFCSGTGTRGTARVEVERAEVDATLVLSIDGSVVRTWTGVAAGTAYSHEFAIAVGDERHCVFTLSAAGCADVSADVTVEGRIVGDWFDVPFTNGVYAS